MAVPKPGFKLGDVVRKQLGKHQAQEGVIVDKQGCKPGEVAWVSNDHMIEKSSKDVYAQCIDASSLKKTYLSLMSDTSPLNPFVNGNRVIEKGSGRIGTVVLNPRSFDVKVSIVFDSGDGKVEAIPVKNLKSADQEIYENLTIGPDQEIEFELSFEPSTVPMADVMKRPRPLSQERIDNIKRIMKEVKPLGD